LGEDREHAQQRRRRQAAAADAGQEPALADPLRRALVVGLGDRQPCTQVGDLAEVSRAGVGLAPGCRVRRAAARRRLGGVACRLLALEARDEIAANAVDLVQEAIAFLGRLVGWRSLLA